MKSIKGKIILVDDERYERLLLEIALTHKQWDVEMMYFEDSAAALEFLKKTNEEIFLVIVDMNMPKMSGLELKKAIDKDDGLSKKLIPFIFFSNADTDEQVTAAYNYRVQGYFKKPMTINEQADQLDIIINYWRISKRPHKVLA